MLDWLGPTVAPEELALFLVSAVGAGHHAFLLRRAIQVSRVLASPVDQVLLRVHLRHEASRLVLKLIFGYGAILMMLAPANTSLAEVWPWATLVWRYGLIMIALWLDIESFLAAADRRSILRLGDPHA